MTVFEGEALLYKAAKSLSWSWPQKVAMKPVWSMAPNMPELNLGQQTHSPKVPVKEGRWISVVSEGVRSQRRAASAYSGNGM